MDGHAQYHKNTHLDCFMILFCKRNKGCRRCNCICFGFWGGQQTSAKYIQSKEAGSFSMHPNGGIHQLNYSRCIYSLINRDKLAEF